MRPRSYSISSSSLESPQKVSITAVVESRDLPGAKEQFYGVATNYLLALQRSLAKSEAPAPLSARDYQLDGPRKMLVGHKIPFFINSSSFRLPADPRTPVIMVGPGSGVAPFRGFIRHYAALSRKGVPVGKMVLFFGCRSRHEDFMYEEEWQVSSFYCPPCPFAFRRTPPFV
jgi:NADPH-ferrihemoprotein reductase